MTFHLVHADDHALLASDTAVIKRAQRVDFTDAVALLQASAAIRDRASAEAESARAAAVQAIHCGRSAGRGNHARRSRAPQDAGPVLGLAQHQHRHVAGALERAQLAAQAEPVMVRQVEADEHDRL